MKEIRVEFRAAGRTFRTVCESLNDVATGASLMPDAEVVLHGPVHLTAELLARLVAPAPVPNGAAPTAPASDADTKGVPVPPS